MTLWGNKGLGVCEGEVIVRVFKEGDRRLKSAFGV
jgi:hypothetical protein